MSAEPKRPLRIPNHVQMTTAEPSFAKADQPGLWSLPFVLARDVLPGEVLWFHIHGGRNMPCRWHGLQVKDGSAEGYLSLRTDSGEVIQPTGEAVDDGLFVFTVPASGLKNGQQVIASLHNVVAPKLSATERFFVLHAVPAETELAFPLRIGEPPDLVVGACWLPIIGGDMASIQVYAPSTVAASQEISLLTRPEDAYHNTACAAPGYLVVRLNGCELPARHVPVESSACCRLEGITLPCEGVCRLEVEDTISGFRAQTNPIRVSNGFELLWGTVHGHTEMSDGAGTLDRYFTYMRDECGVDFGCTSDHDHTEDTPEWMWQLSQEAAMKYNEPGRFTVFLGYEWAKWRKRGDGDRNVYYLHDHRGIYRSCDHEYPTPPELFEALKDEEALVIPHHPAHIGNHNDWKDHDPEKERLVEIYSYWGCSERSVEDGNIYPGSPIHEGNPNSGSNPLGYVQRALAMGWRVGFVAASDDHLAHASDQTVRHKAGRDYTGGYTAVYASENTRDAVFESLRNRYCYGTTGARIIADFDLNRQPMGSELRLSDYPELANERRIRVSVNGTAKIRTIEIVRNNVDVHTFTPDGPDFEGEWVDTESLGAGNLPPAQWSPVPLTFYYIRITQDDNQQAWLSPVWISE